MKNPEWLVGGGELGDRIRALDWSQTPLGPRSDWPASLRTIVHLLCATRCPTALFWGPERVLLYNDGCGALLGGEHPRRLGRPAREAWPFGPVDPVVLDGVLARGESVDLADVRWPLEDPEGPEEAWYRVSFSPLRTDRGSIEGVLVTFESTSTRVRAERTIVEVIRRADAEHQRLEAVLEALPAGVALADAGGRVERFNGALSRIWGDPPLPRSIDEYETWRAWWADSGEPLGPRDWALAKALTDGVTVPGDVIEIERFDGSGRAVIVNAAAPIRNREGAIVGGVVAAVDITAQRRAEAALRGSERVHRLLARTGDLVLSGLDLEPLVRASSELVGRELGVSRCGFSFIDVDAGRLTVLADWSSELPTLTGVHSLEVCAAHQLDVGQVGGVAAIADLADHPLTAPVFATVFAPIHVRAQVTVPLHRQGRWVASFWACHHAVRAWMPAEIEAMKLVAERVFAIVERKHAESAIRASEERLRIALDAAQFGTFDLDPTTGQATWDAQMRRIWGLAEDEPIDLARAAALVHPADRPRLHEVLRAALEPGSTGLYAAEYRIVRPDGAVRWAAARGRVEFTGAGADRRPVRVIGVERDVTERKEAEEALRAANQRLVEADRRKDEFIGMLSHELRNPLAPIRNAAALLRRAPGEAPATRAHAVLERQIDHLSRLVDELLDVTRIRRGKFELRRSRVDLRELLRRSAEDARLTLGARGVTLRAELGSAPVWAEADPTRVVQLLGNLLGNTAKFARPGDQVVLSLSAVEGEAEIRVRDTGPGIHPSLLPFVFEPFVQGERSLDRTEGGLGLGLALVRGIAELHGGSARAESEGLGRGAEFIVRLPAEGRAGAVDAPNGALDRSAAGRRVLIVDDNVDAAETLAELVALQGHSVEVAHDGPSAVARALARPPDVVLCDIGLPGMSGLDVARALRGRLPSARLVAVSGYAQPEDVRSAAEAGFDAHVAKPPDPQRIERLIGE